MARDVQRVAGSRQHRQHMYGMQKATSMSTSQKYNTSTVALGSADVGGSAGATLGLHWGCTGAALDILHCREYRELCAEP
jgi:hypothetical protein